MANRLAGANSPYLLQHANNPVDWYPWGEAALARARNEDKPIFLSIGYAACHWCHVMAHESFEDPHTAEILNDGFICIKVDREERPDLDAIYMQATTSMTGAGGWPMSVFLTPDLRPFYAGTYFPPVRRYNLPGFSDLLLALVGTWRNRRSEILDVASRVRAALDPPKSTPAARTGEGALDAGLLTRAETALVHSADREHGGWGGAPKFPQPMSIEFLLRRSAADPAEHSPALAVATETLQRMARGGMYDFVGGGFARYSTDVNWLVPHFEKMLYDNAQLAIAYLHARVLTGDPFYGQVTMDTLDFVTRELMHPNGGFFSSLDADSAGGEGSYYAWTDAELRAAIGDQARYEIFSAAYGLTSRGNWEGRTILQRALGDTALADHMKISTEAASEALARGREQLLAARSLRPRPATDDKVICAWNGLMLRAFASAARYLGQSDKGKHYLQVATRNAAFLLSNLRGPDGLHRIWRDGHTGDQVFLEDYAAAVLGLLELYQADFDNRWFTAAQQLTDDMIDRFADADGGFFDTPHDAEPLLIRPKDIQDNATPSGNALACEGLLRLAALTGEGRYRDIAEHSLALGLQIAGKYPTSFGRWLCAADLALSHEQQLALLYPSHADAASFLKVANSTLRPNLLLAASVFPPPSEAPPLLKDRPLLDDLPTAYLCEGLVCKQPTSDSAELRSQL